MQFTDFRAAAAGRGERTTRLGARVFTAHVIAT
jgi:hypothetical protein